MVVKEEAREKCGNEGGNDEESGLTADAARCSIGIVGLNGVHFVVVHGLSWVFGGFGLLRALFVVARSLAMRVIDRRFAMSGVHVVIAAAVLVVTTSAVAAGVVKIFVVVVSIRRAVAVVTAARIHGIAVVIVIAVVAAITLRLASAARVHDILSAGPRPFGRLGDLARHGAARHVLLDAEQLLQDGGNDLLRGDLVWSVKK